MTILLLLLILILVFLVLLSVYPLKIAFSVNSYDIPDYNVTFSWLNPFLKGRVEKNENNKVIIVYILGKKVFQRSLTNASPDLNKIVAMLRQIKPEYISLQASYGSQDPSITGIIYGAINAMSSYLNFDELHINPDFLVEDSYFNAKGIVRINMLNAIIRYFSISRKLIPE